MTDVWDDDFWAICPCHSIGPSHRSVALRRDLGEDPVTQGDVRLLTCLACHEPWLHYRTEDPHGRWYACLVEEATAATVTAAEALPLIKAQAWYIFGGSHYGHGPRRAGVPLAKIYGG